MPIAGKKWEMRVVAQISFISRRSQLSIASECKRKNDEIFSIGGATLRRLNGAPENEGRSGRKANQPYCWVHQRGVAKL
jgi:hypothetical protein